jgi:hypothetical protein
MTKLRKARSKLAVRKPCKGRRAAAAGGRKRGRQNSELASGVDWVESVEKLQIGFERDTLKTVLRRADQRIILRYNN